jgi:hypothetical protein
MRTGSEAIAIQEISSTPCTIRIWGNLEKVLKKLSLAIAKFCQE